MLSKAFLDRLEEKPYLLNAFFNMGLRLHEEVYEHLWNWGQEDAWLNVSESDCHNMLWDGTMTKCTFGLVGRGGGHLVIEEWNGWRFTGKSTEELIEELSDPEAMMYKELRLLYKFHCQWSHDFTPARASAEVEYLSAYRFFDQLSSKWEESGLEEARLPTFEDVKEAVGVAGRLLTEHSFAESHEAFSALETLARAAGADEETIKEAGL